jgi:uncharacterized protein YjbI with pentapeptide repeats
VKKAVYLLIGLLAGGIIGWIGGYLRVPYLTDRAAFWLGGLACMAVLIALAALVFAFKKGRSSASKQVDTKARSYGRTALFFALWIVASSLVGSYLFFRQKTQFDQQKQSLQASIQAQKARIDRLNAESYTSLMSNVLQAVDDELNTRKDGSLSEGLIDRIISLTHYLKPYQRMEGDSLSKVALSPERGQLLQALCAMNIDSLSFVEIKSKASFDHADLNAADLTQADLSLVKLRGANLEDGKLRGADLRGADLRNAHCTATDLQGAFLEGADMKRANLSWATLSGASMPLSSLDGANLSNAQLLKADLRGAHIRFTEISGAMLNHADLEAAVLFRTKCIKTNFSDANLRGAVLQNTSLDQAIMTHTKLTNALVEKERLGDMKGKGITGYDALLRRYAVVEDTLERHHIYRYCLKARE